MTVPAWLRPKQPAWFMGTLATIGLLFAAYLIIAWLSPWRPGRWAGLVFGWLAAVLFLNAALYPARRPVAWPWKTAQQWLQLHVYGSVVASVAVLCHIGFQLPSGWMGWSLLTLSLWTAATGLVGVVLQKWIPTVLTAQTGAEVLAVRAPALLQTLLQEADGLAAGAAGRVAATYESSVRPALQQARARWTPLPDAAGAAALTSLRALQPIEKVEDADRVASWQSIVQDKLAIDLHLGLQGLLRAWLLLHVPPALVLMGLLAVHITAVWLY